jgi:hypothetical protein
VIHLRIRGAHVRHHARVAINYNCRATCPICGWSPELPVSPPPCPDTDPPICPWFFDDSDSENSRQRAHQATP